MKNSSDPNKFIFGTDNFQDLMLKKIHNILLVSTYYDAFIFEQDGLFSEKLFGEFDQLNLSEIPRITNVTTAKEALNIIDERNFDLVITMLRVGEISPYELSAKIKEKQSQMPILLLLNNESDIEIVKRNETKLKDIDDIFLWHGDSTLFLAMIKYVEDIQNVERDTKSGFVHVILIVEDSIRYYSRFLPLLYTEIMQQTQRLISAELSFVNKRRRMRTRPKLLLVHDYEAAVKIIERYKENLICVISDMEYAVAGKLDKDAGQKLMKKIGSEEIQIAKLLQSNNIDNLDKAENLDAKFLFKNSQTLLKDIRKFILQNLGFGDLVFRNNKGQEIARASNLLEFERLLSKVPAETILYHAQRNHFSAWLVAHGELNLARKIRPLKIDNFSNACALRRYLQMIFKEIRLKKNRGKLIEFDPNNIDPEGQIIRLFEGSLGGKGRGLVFLNSLINSLGIDRDLDNLILKMPKTYIIGTDAFDRFIKTNKIKETILEKHYDKKSLLKDWNENDDAVALLQKISISDEDINAIFLNGWLPKSLKKKLRSLLSVNRSPLAVRSSGLLEDSQSQPFAGVYRTFMLPNDHPDINERLHKLTQAIKLVFASVFLKNAREYISNINYKLEEEKMAVIIQNIVGSEFDKIFYPHVSGVAQSHNFYPTGEFSSADGIAAIAVGLGKMVVEGESNFVFCPKYPKKDIISQEDIVKSRQRHLYAIDLHEANSEMTEEKKFSIRKLKDNGSFFHLASVWDYDNERLTENLTAKGPLIINFSNILKYDYIPVAKLLDRILQISKRAMGVPIEIEFAVKLNRNNMENVDHTFHLLQIRPLNVQMENSNIEVSELVKKELLLYAENAMGNGLFDSIKDIVVFRKDKFDNTKTLSMQKEIEKFNNSLKEEGKPYLLIGPGRWGSRDRFLGIPVRWNQISNAKTIVEIGLENFHVDASQGTHFFHNLVSMNVGYFSIDERSKQDHIDLDWLYSQTAKEKAEYFNHYSFEDEIIIKIDGKKRIAIIKKPEK